ncbi:MAG: DUF4056 domain-containing protein [Phycisphaerales bacterium JB038]
MADSWRRFASTVAWLVLLLQAGCYPTLGPLARLGRHNGPVPIEETPPKLRVGSLPYPLPLIPLETVPADDLGRHVYEGSFAPFWAGEVSRGIVYTERAGFLDIAHIRNAADLTRYAYLHVREALREERSGVILVSAEPSLYHITFAYDDAWREMPTEEREAVERELALRLSQRLAHVMCTWHEIITWYGYRALLPIPERQSAFSYDDPPSHMVGIELAGRALRALHEEWEDDEALYEEALTSLLGKDLERYEVQPPVVARRAARAVKNDWWTSSPGHLKRRLVHVGCNEEALHPWLVPAGEGEAEQADPIAWVLPTLTDVLGRDCRGMVTVEIEPNIWEGASIRRDLALPDGHISPRRHFGRLAEVIRAEEAERWGSDSADTSFAE